MGSEIWVRINTASFIVDDMIECFIRLSEGFFETPA